MYLQEEKFWFVHNEKEQIWTGSGWGSSFEEAILCRTEDEGDWLSSVLRAIFPLMDIGYNPIFEIYTLSVVDKSEKLLDDFEYTGNKMLPFTAFYGRGKVFFDRARAEKEADRLWFEVFEENSDIDIAVVFAGGDGNPGFCSFSREEQEQWFKKRELEWRRKRDEEEKEEENEEDRGGKD